MKHIYKILLALIAVAAGWGQNAKAQNSGGFGYSANCLKVSLWAQDKRAFDSCASVKFTLNNTYVTGVQASYTFPSAGTYTVCMKISNTCKKWDTTVCQNITVKACNSCDWSKAAWSYKVDCRKITVEGNNLLTSCYKYTWAIDGQTIKSRTFSYTFSKDGNYKICMKVYDSCNNCDTTICKEISIKCNTCNWASLKPEIITYTSGKNCLRYMWIAKNLNDSCIRYSWTLDGKAHALFNGQERYISDSFVSNGTHTICLKLTDNCRQCDTTICTTITVTGCGSKCNFSGLDFSAGFKCKQVTFEAKNLNNPCLKYQFYVFVGNTSYALNSGRVATYNFANTGNYYVKLVVSDTCNNCDTFMYKVIEVTCSPCNWSAFKPQIYPYTTGSGCVRYWFGATYIQDSCVSYSWTLDGKAHDNYKGQERYMTDSFAMNGTHTVCLKLKNICKNCDTTICYTFTVNGCGKKCDFSWLGFSYGNKCRTYTFEGKNNSGCLKYQFAVLVNNNFVMLPAGRVSSYTFPQTGTYYVRLFVTDTCTKCDTAIYQTIKVDCNPCNLKPEFSWKNDCLKAYFNAGVVNGATYYWSFGDGYYSSLKEPWHQYLKKGTYTVCLKVTYKDPNSGQECSETVCKQITISCGNDCNIKGDFQFSRSGNQVKFSSSSNNGYYYFWSFGDGTFGSGKNPAHFYKKPGNYEVCLTIYDKNKKCYVKICKKVVIPEICNVRAYFAFKQSGNTVKFVGIAYNGNKYVWSFGDGTSGSGKDPSHTYTYAGVYNVCLTVYSSNGKCHTTICKRIVITTGSKRCDWAKLGADFSYNVNCPNLVLEGKNLNNTGSNCFSYSWGITPVNTNQTTMFYGRVQNIKFSSNGTFNVCMKVYDSCHNCDTVICKTVTVNCNSSKCNWKGENPYFAVWDSCKAGYGYIGFNSNRSGCFKYTWKVNGNVASHDRYFKFPITQNGKYEICVNVRDTCKNCDTTFCGVTNVTCFKSCDWSAKYPKFNYMSIGASCSTVVAGINTSSAPCIRHYYSLNGGKFEYNGQTAHTWNISQNGTYKVCLKLVDTCSGCDTIICREVQVNCNRCDLSKADFNYKVDCNKVTVEGSNLGGCVIYGFGWGDGTGSSYARVADHRYTKNGTYTICFKAYDTCNKCDTLICKSVKIDCQPCSAKAMFDLDSTNSSGIAYFTNQSTGGYAYVWDFGDSTYSYSANPGKHAYAASGSYTICLTVYDSAKSCSTQYCYTFKLVKSRAGIAAVDKLPEVTVFPNPADAYFTIVSDNRTGTYEIVNLRGHMMTTGNIQGESRVSSSGWAEGVYIVRATFGGAQVNTRLVITRQ